MSQSPVCDVVLPCRDEALALPIVLQNVPEGLRVIVVDNGSRDNTSEVARSLGAVVVHEPRPGYGAAVHAGLLASTSEFVAVMDADATMRMSDLVRLLGIALDSGADMVVGRRRPVARRVWPWHARLGTELLAWWIRLSSHLPIHDLAPMRVCRRTKLLALGIEDRRFGYPLELMLRASHANWRVMETDIDYLSRAAGTRSKVSGSLRGTMRVAKDFVGVMR